MKEEIEKILKILSRILVFAFVDESTQNGFIKLDIEDEKVQFIVSIVESIK